MNEQDYDYNDWDEVSLEDEEEELSSPVFAANSVLVQDLWRKDEINKPAAQVQLEQEALFRNPELKHLYGDNT